MRAIDKIFEGYYEERLSRGDPPEMSGAYSEIEKMIGGDCGSNAGMDRIMEEVGVYGMEAEKTGFMAGFRAAWELLRDMQEGGDTAASW